MDVSAILWALLGGAAAGLVTTWVTGLRHHEVPLWLSVLAGVAGILVGTVVHDLVFDAPIVGVDWWQHAWQVGAAAVLLTGLSELSRVRSRDRARSSARYGAR